MSLFQALPTPVGHRYDGMNVCMYVINCRRGDTWKGYSDTLRKSGCKVLTTQIIKNIKLTLLWKY